MHAHEVLQFNSECHRIIDHKAIEHLITIVNYCKLLPYISLTKNTQGSFYKRYK